MSEVYAKRENAKPQKGQMLLPVEENKHDLKSEIMYCDAEKYNTNEGKVAKSQVKIKVQIDPGKLKEDADGYEKKYSDPSDNFDQKGYAVIKAYQDLNIKLIQLK